MHAEVPAKLTSHGKLTTVEEITDIEELRKMYLQANEANARLAQHNDILAFRVANVTDLLDRLFKFSTLYGKVQDISTVQKGFAEELDTLTSNGMRRSDSIVKLMHRLDALERPEVFGTLNDDNDS